MRRSDTLGSRYRRFCARRRRFFTEDYPRVIERNFRNVRVACLMACAIAALFTPVAALCVPAWHPSVAHYALAPIALALYGLMRVASPRLATRPWAAAVACLVVEALLLVAIGLLDTVFAAGRVGVLTQPVGIGLGVLITTPWGLPLGVLGLTDALFVALSFATKPLAAIMHDVGKIAIPDAILCKPGRLAREEFEVMKSHTVQGAELLERIPQMRSMGAYRYAVDIARHHHERWDGRGYPDGLAGDEISVPARVVSLADVYDALTNKRVYKAAFTREESLRMIADGECGAFNPELLSCFFAVEPQIAALYQAPAVDSAHKPEGDAVSAPHTTTPSVN